MRTTEPSGGGREAAASTGPKARRASKAAVAKIVLTGCSTGAALGMVGVMAMAETPPPELQQVPPPDPAAAAPTTTATPVTLPPRKVIRYVYRPVIVQDGAPTPAPAPRAATSRSYTTAAAPSAAPAPAPAPVAAAPRPKAVTTTTTKGS